MRLILLLCLVAFSVHGFGQYLRVSVGQLTAMVGQPVEVLLSIKDVQPSDIRGLDSTLKITDGPTALFGRAKAQEQFIYRFYFTLEEPRSFWVGPYTVQFEGKELVSDSVFIQVVNPDSAHRTILVNAPAEVEAGLRFEVICESSFVLMNSLEMVEQNGLEVLSTSSGMSMSFSEGYRLEHYTRKFLITIDAKGEFFLDKSFFVGVDDIYVPPVVILVK